MKKLFQLALTLGFLSIASSVNAAPSWSGNYEYFEDGGSTAGGTPVLITHELHIWKGKHGFEAKVEANGYQTYKDFTCTAKASGNILNVYFVKAGSKYMYFDGKRGDLMFRLERTKARGPRGLVTLWKRYGPVTMEKYPARAIAFVQRTNRRER